MPASKIRLEQAPYDRNGSLLHYVASWEAKDPERCRWLPNEPFLATLSIKTMRSGRSAKYVILSAPSSADEREFPMFVSDLIDAIASLPAIYGGIMVGRWMVRKRGQNYGLALAPE